MSDVIVKTVTLSTSLTFSSIVIIFKSTSDLFSYLETAELMLLTYIKLPQENVISVLYTRKKVKKRGAIYCSPLVSLASLVPDCVTWGWYLSGVEGLRCPEIFTC